MRFGFELVIAIILLVPLIYKTSFQILINLIWITKISLLDKNESGTRTLGCGFLVETLKSKI